MIRVLLADDHTMVRQGLRSLLEVETDIEVVGEAKDGEEAVEKAVALSPDVVVMDVVMPKQNGIEATRTLKARLPSTKILVLSMYDQDEYVRSLLKAGAAGYIIKQAAGEDLVRAIREVHAGNAFLHPKIAATVLSDYAGHADSTPGKSESVALTSREREVLALIAAGHSNREVASMLALSPKTVDVHRTNIMRKLDIHNVTELVKHAIRAGLLTLSSP